MVARLGQLLCREGNGETMAHGEHDGETMAHGANMGQKHGQDGAKVGQK